MQTTLKDKFKNAVGWRWRKIADVLPSRWAEAKLGVRWRLGWMARKHALPAPLVVSLTSFPLRFDTLHLTLKSLLCQTIKADHIVLWIAEKDFAALPSNVTDLQNHGLEIRAAPDTRSYKKILPALDAFPDAYICTADDDIYYWSTWLEELVKSVGMRSGFVSCHRGHRITTTPSGEYLPYANWEFDIRSRGEIENLFPTGAAGILYSPSTLLHSPEDREDATGLCPYADDVWLFWIGRRNGARYIRPPKSRGLIMWTGSQAASLWQENLTNGRNDDQIQKIAAKHGYPKASRTEARTSH